MEDNLEAEYAPEKETPPEEAPEAGSDAQIDRGYGQKSRAADEKKRGKKKKGHPVLRTILVWTVSVILLGIIGIMALSRTMYQDSSLLTLPENAISSAVTPVQTWFSGIVQSISDYFYMVRLRSNWEAEYNRVVAENMELASVVARNAELEKQLSQFTNMQEEIVTNANMNPLTAQVIAREQGTYFSVFTVNKGSRDGVEPYMAVTISGALVGFTETVYDTSCTVRTIIDSDASIAGMIQSSRDQGIVSGTLGVDGTALCRMIPCRVRVIKWSLPAWASPSPKASRLARCANPPAAWKATNSTSSLNRRRTSSTWSTSSSCVTSRKRKPSKDATPRQYTTSTFRW